MFTPLPLNPSGPIMHDTYAASVLPVAATQTGQWTDMGRRSKNTSFEKGQLVIYHKEKSKIYRQIARMLQIPKSTVANIIKRYKDEDRIDFFLKPAVQEHLQLVK